MSLVIKAKAEILEIITQAMQNFEQIDPPSWNKKPNRSTWSKKELLGHLIDSASNNLRRFIVAQYEQGTKIIYDQDKWVDYQNYQAQEIDDLKLLWKLLNHQIAHVIGQIPQSKLDFTVDTGRGKVELHSLVYFIEDYIVHLKYHLNQLVDPAFNIDQIEHKLTNN